MLGLNLTLALAWCAMAGELTIGELLLGFAGSFVMLAWLDVDGSGRRYAIRVPVAIAFLAFYIIDIVHSAVRLAWDVITPGSGHHPAIIQVPLEARTDIEVVLLANLVTFTPGSVALDVSDDRRTMTIHAMYGDDPDKARRDIKRFERWVLRILR